MIWDCFPYWREHQLIAARQELWRQAGIDVNLVAFIGDSTLRGKPKPACPPPPAGVRVVDVKLGNFDENDKHGLERQQRDAVLTIVDEMEPDDLVLLCDADEIVDPAALDRIADRARIGTAALEMWLYPFDYRWRCEWVWNQPRAMYAANLRGLSGNVRAGWVMKSVQRAGWHLTTHDDAKIAAIAHYECDTVEHRAHVAQCLVERTDFEGRPLVDDCVPDTLACLLP